MPALALLARHRAVFLYLRLRLVCVDNWPYIKWMHGKVGVFSHLQFLNKDKDSYEGFALCCENWKAELNF